MSLFGKWKRRREPIFILPTVTGFLFALLCLSVFLVGSWSRREPLFIITFALVTLGLLAMIMTNGNLSKIDCQVLPSEPAAAGTPLNMRLQLIQKNSDPSIGLQVSFMGGKKFEAALAGSKTIGYHLKEEEPRLINMTRVRVSSVYPVGLFFAWRLYAVDGETFIYPKPINHLDNRSRLGDAEAGTEPSLASSFGSSEFEDHKPYYTGDNPRRIDWRVAARRDELLTRVYYDEANQSPKIARWADTEGLPHSERLEQLSYWLLENSKSGGRFGLELPERSIDLGYGKGHLYECLRALTEKWISANHEEETADLV